MRCNWKTAWPASRVNALKPHCVSAKGEGHHQAGDGVETSAEKAAVEWLLESLALDFEPARADGDVGTFANGGEEQFGLFHGGRKIGIREHDDLPGGLQHAVAYAVSFAPVTGIVYEANDGVFGRELLDDGSGIVGGPVVDDENLSVPAMAMNALEVPAPGYVRYVRFR